jgi:hypothetical protein
MGCTTGPSDELRRHRSTKRCSKQAAVADITTSLVTPWQVRVGDFGLAPLMLTSPSEAGDSSARGKEKEDTDEPPTPTDGPAHKGVLASPGVRSAASPGEKHAL